METNVLTLTEMYQKENGIEADDNQRFKGMCIKYFSLYFSLCSVYVQCKSFALTLTFSLLLLHNGPGVGVDEHGVLPLPGVPPGLPLPRKLVPMVWVRRRIMCYHHITPCKIPSTSIHLYCRICTYMHPLFMYIHHIYTSKHL